MLRVPQRLAVYVLACAAVGACAVPAEAQFYAIQNIDVPTSMAQPQTTIVIGVNDLGDVVGAFISNGSPSMEEGFKLSGGVYTPIVYPGSSITFATGINNAGDITGYYVDSGPCAGVHGFLLSNGAYAPIDVPGALNGCLPTTQAWAINNRGDIAGSFFANGKNHGFVYSNGGFTVLDIPNTGIQAAPGGCCQTLAFGLNDLGTVVGWYINNNGYNAFIYGNGTYTAIDRFPSNVCFGCAGPIAYGVNDKGTVLLTPGSSIGANSVILDNGSYRDFKVPGATSTLGHGINNLGWIAGNYAAAGGGHGFVAISLSVVEPTRSMLQGSHLTSDYDLLAKEGRPVTAIAADGATEVVLRVPGSAGGHVTVTLMNDHLPSAESTSAEEDGALGMVGSDDISLSHVDVPVQSTASGPLAFVVYRAPVDFARALGGGFRSGGCDFSLTTDDQSACRNVSFHIQSSAGLDTTLQVDVLRPPVALIHGLWGDASTWDNFPPLFSSGFSNDGRFTAEAVNYGLPVPEVIESTDPVYDPKDFSSIKASSLGVAYNAWNVFTKVLILLKAFRTGDNPIGAQAAATQADVVAHSMGGLIARYITRLPSFFDDQSLGQGYFHKIITLDTPYLGSPLALRLLTSDERGKCLQNTLAWGSQYSLNTVTLSIGTLPGAIGDLQGDTDIGALSVTLALLRGNAAPTAPLAGTSSSFDGLDTNLIAAGIRAFCGTPLAQSLTSTGWQAVFHGALSDGVVGQLSQLDGDLLSALDAQFDGILHSSALSWLGFSGTSVLSSAFVGDHVVFLLNTSPKNSLYFRIGGL